MYTVTYLILGHKKKNLLISPAKFPATLITTYSDNVKEELNGEISEKKNISTVKCYWIKLLMVYNPSICTTTSRP